MAKTRNEMKEAMRSASLDVMSPEEYDKEMREFIAVNGTSMAEMAALGAEVLGGR